MRTADGRYTIVFNGEIYNFQALRAMLEQRGHVFRTRSDTEVLLYAYIEWGVRCGGTTWRHVYAFAIYDTLDGTLFALPAIESASSRCITMTTAGRLPSHRKSRPC